MITSISGSQPGAILAPKVHLAMSGGILVVTIGGGGHRVQGGCYAPHRAQNSPTAKNDVAQNITRAIPFFTYWPLA